MKDMKKISMIYQKLITLKITLIQIKVTSDREISLIQRYFKGY